MQYKASEAVRGAESGLCLIKGPLNLFLLSICFASVSIVPCYQPLQAGERQIAVFFNGMSDRKG